MHTSNKKIIKLSILLFLIIILLIITSILLINNSSELQKTANNVEVNVLEPDIELMEVKSITEHKSVEYCVNQYLSYIKNKEAEAVYSILIEDYIDTENVTVENVLNKLQITDYENIFSAKKIYSFEAQLGISTYLVNGKIYNKDLRENYDYNIILNIDYSNNTFEIAPLEETYIDYIDYSDIDNIKIKDKTLEDKIKKIEKSNFNKVKITSIYEDKEIMKYYFEQYILSMVYNANEAYQLLDKEYQQKRFAEYEDFESYVEKYQEDLQRSFIVQYKIKEYEDYKEYLCKDNNNNYYIFKETSPMEYTVLLDQYTIEDKIFMDSYEKQEDSSKAQMKLNQFEQMINRSDYTSAYKVLNEEFRTKYFNTEEKFIEYISKNFYKYNSFEYTEISEDDEQYRIKTKISNVENSFRENMIKRFKVELLEDDTYSISFDI